MLKNSSFGKSVSNVLGKVFGRLPIDPNAITILSVLMAIFGYITWLPLRDAKVQSIIFFALAFFFDALDGTVARIQKKETKQGAFLDGIADRFVEFFMVLVLFKIYTFNIEVQFLLLTILFFGTFMTSFAKAYGEHQGLLSHEEALKVPGIFERTERCITLLVIFILASYEHYQLVQPLLYLTAALCIITFAERFWHIYSKK